MARLSAPWIGTDGRRWIGVVCGLMVAASLGVKGDGRRADRTGIDMQPCTVAGVDGPARCGTLTVFENRRTKQGRTIDLNIVVIPAAGATRLPEPVFWLHGGPGAAATTTAPDVNGGFLESFHRDRDLVFVDQRGTGKSN